MDYLGNLVQIGNVTVAGDTATFLYQIDPINQVYQSDDVSQGVTDAFVRTISTVYKQGAIYLVPKKINVIEKLDWVDTTHKQYAEGKTTNLYGKFRKETETILTKEMIYQHDIFFCIVTNRREFKSKSFARKINETVFGSQPVITKTYQKNLMQSSDHFLEIITRRFKARKISKDEAYEMYQALVRPVFKNQVDKDYYINPQDIEHLKFRFTETNGNEEYYMRTYYVENTENKPHLSRMISGLTLKKHPILITIKFDPRASNKAVEIAEEKVEEFKEEQKKHQENIGRRSRQIDESIKQAKLSSLVFDDPDEIEMLTQIFVRIEARSENLLNERANNLKLYLEDGFKLKLNAGVGKQHDIMINSFPFLNIFQDRKSILYWTFGLFVDLQPFAGIKIGMDKGIPITYTYGKQSPVWYDFLKPFKNETAHAQPAIGVVGESGGGKSELVKYLEMMLLSVYGAPILKFDPKGEPDNLHRHPDLQGLYQKIILGTTESTKGIFDPLLRYKNDDRLAKEEAKKDIRFILNAINKKIEDPFLIDESIERIQLKYRNNEINRPTMLHVIDDLISHEEQSESWLIGRNLKHASTMPLATLFFASDETKTTIDFSSYLYNIIQFDRMPKIKEFDSTNMTHLFVSHVLSKCNSIAEDFVRTNPDDLKIVTVEEYGVFKKTPEGEMAVDDMVRLCRAFTGIPIIVSQNLTDYGDNLEAIMNNIGALFIGNIRSKTELDFIIKELELEDNQAIKKLLRKKGENDSAADKYVFLFVDHNDRKAFIRNKQYDLFSKYFDTSGNRNSKEV